MKKIVLALAVMASVASADMCGFFVKKASQSTKFATFAIQRNDVADLLRATDDQIRYLEKSIVHCDGFVDEKGMAMLTEMRDRAIETKNKYGGK